MCCQACSLSWGWQWEANLFLQFYSSNKESRRWQTFFKPGRILMEEAWNSGMSSATNLLPNIMAMEERVWRSLGKFAGGREKERKKPRCEAEPNYGAMTERQRQALQHIQDMLQNPFLSRATSTEDNIPRGSASRIEGLQSTQTSSICSGWTGSPLSSCRL